ncbi:dTDP-4-dehydrorhamnose reductase [Bacillus massiliglaciei]|uniref:dTDP-4-dehydrorhamnose reductase n=1 Tax=Bacillus massiliglaciei TaxID=1816693 RepID=UPI000B2177BE|nr:dTDP-4-dehydrorhamnose reductase [Bacillus massiliglaciei]
MKILVTGGSGQLGYDVLKEGKRKGFIIQAPSSSEFNVTNEEQVHKYITTFQPDVIVHCAAYTAVDQAEDEVEKTYDINVNGTKYIAIAAKEIDAKLIYISTDYVFEGTGDQPYTENDLPNPIGQYGKTKYEGETIVANHLEKYFIVRISWVFGLNGNNFIKTMLRLSETRDVLNVVGDQVGSPTYTADLAYLLLELAQSEIYGIYHATNEGFCSWSEFAEEIFKQAHKEVTVHSITTEEYPTKAARPKNSRLSKNKIEENGFRRLPKWQDALSRYLTELEEEVKER